MKHSKRILATTFALTLSLPVLADGDQSAEEMATNPVPTNMQMMNPAMMQQMMQNRQGMNPGQMMQNRQGMNPGQMMGNPGAQMMNPQMMQNRQGMYPNQMMGNPGGQMMNPQMMQNRQGMYPYHRMNPQMQQMMGMKQGHMNKMEGLLTSIDASLKKLVALQEK